MSSSSGRFATACESRHLLRRLWLVFAQVVTATLAAIFVVSLVKPEWLSWRSNVVEIRETAQPAATFPASPGRLVSFSDAARKAIPSVVNISATRQVKRRSPVFDDPVLRRFFGERFNVPETQLSLGSGVIVSREGFILTNSHVVEGVTEIQVTLHDGRNVPGKIVGSDPETDLAVVRVSASGLTPITFGQSEQLRVGDIVLAIGDPFSVGQTVTMGIVSAVGREIGSANPFGSFIQTDAAINPGNSGGALVDGNGNLVGINSLIFSRSGGYQGIGFAIPVSLARKIMEQIIETGSVTRGWFGVEVANITPELAESLGLPGTRGAIVGGIERGSPAERAGIRLGDVILAVGERNVQDLTATLNAIADIPPGKTVQVKVARKNQEVTLAVTVGKRKPRPAGEE
jgi:serine protease DegQ